jgi:hypothetical protein
MPAMRTRMSRPRPGPASRPGPGVLAAHWDEVHALLAVLRQRQRSPPRPRRWPPSSRRSAGASPRSSAALGVVLFERGGRRPGADRGGAAAARRAPSAIEAELSRFRRRRRRAARGSRSSRSRPAGADRGAGGPRRRARTSCPRCAPRHPALAVDLLTSYRAVGSGGRARGRHRAALLPDPAPATWSGAASRGITTAVLAAREPTRGACAATPLAELPLGHRRAARGSPRPRRPGSRPRHGAPHRRWCARATRSSAPPSAPASASASVPAVYASHGPRPRRAAAGAAHPLPTLDLYLVTRRAIRTLPRVVAVIDALTAAGPALEARAGGAGRV